MRGKNIAFFVGICVIIGWIAGILLMQIYGQTHREPIIPQYNDNTPVVALTFDDGPNARYTPQVLDILYEYQAPSTFSWLEKNFLGKNGLWKKSLQAATKSDAIPTLTGILLRWIPGKCRRKSS